MADTRKARGMRTQLLVADTFKADGFPHAEPAGAGRRGRDILSTPGLAIEVKATKGWSPLAWLRQAVRNADRDVPAVVARLVGQGEATVDDWAVIMRFGDWRTLIRDAGYGTPPQGTVHVDPVRTTVDMRTPAGGITLTGHPVIEGTR